MWQVYKRKAGKGEFGRTQPAMQAISFKVVYVLVESLVDHLKNGYSHFFFVCLFFFFYNITECDSYRI